MHGVPGPRRLAAGDLVKLDVTARLDGYIADAAVTVPVGEVSAEHQALCDAAHAAFVKALPHVRPGRRVSDVGRVIDAEVRGRGFAVVREVAGHGVGRTIHEPPDVLNYFNPHQRDRFEDGQVVAIEPIITMSQTRLVEDPDGWTLRTKNGVFAAHYEHTVLVTAAGAELRATHACSTAALTPSCDGASTGVAADADDDRRDRVDVRRRGPEVHDARAQRVAAADDGVRDEQLAAALQPIEQLAVDRVEARVDGRIADRRGELGRHVAERRDAERLREQLELRRAPHGVGQRPRQAHVVADHRAIAAGADLAQRQPHLQRAEAARVLRPVVDVVRDALVEVVVRRMVGERGAQVLGVADQRAAGLERRVEPLVRIDGDRIGEADAGEIGRRVLGRGGEPAVGAVDVEPDAVLAADRRRSPAADRPRRC